MAETTKNAEAGTRAGNGHDPAAGPDGSASSGLGAAGSQLSTAPDESAPLPGLGVIGWARWFWRQLTSMRVALLLLFLLSLGSIPGSLIPQTGVDPMAVEEFRAENETLAPLYDKLGLFHVYSSVWFSAIYILLFISLIGCIVPRTWQFAGQLRGRPPAGPSRLTRLPAYTTWRTAAAPEEVLDAAHRTLRRRRFRAWRGGDTAAAEKGYLREAGNLVFHIALIVMLIAFAAGSLWKAEGGKLIVKGDGFTNTLPQYDDFRAASLYDTDELTPFGFRLDDFEATFERGGPQNGTPRTFRADVTHWEGADGAETKGSIEVNHPLEVDGTKVYLIGYGYAPVVTVKDGQGDIAYRGPVPFLPQDTNNTSVGVIKVPDARDKDGEKTQLGFQGRFLPTFALDEVRGPHSTFPALDYPVLSINAFMGSLGVDAGIPQNVYQLDTRKMKQFKENGDLYRKFLRPGETAQLPDGQGSLTFDRVEEWASFQISSQPGKGWALGGAVAALLGLAASLFIHRRRVWVRARPAADGSGTVVEMAALGRSESARLPEELADLAVALRETAPPVPEPDGDTAAGKPDAETAAGKPAEETAAGAPAGDDRENPDPAGPAEGARA
ncbi:MULTISPECIES: cytochrome c biogenesis protein ResB [Streptomyces]|uniref:Cytochrome c biogenesis protein ResB n=2 Tax=Streptomyces TaxID=1883 RepID=A0A3M8F1P0_9ACTN|nr:MULTISPECIES: cytochrome c biogenesis protein ResB [Streptomyces]KNE81171.1 cytochrome C biogenesis protein [Streptomyces fradiae]PQM21429.1 cytochrome c biogenesis protein ResB [Streptomyces xinghaiensis]RKM94511.1 cytochrome c biogenesis protein ResB [Streptomyces xinghaiensis]RNC72110.1 cytochrome c biogenesis protein ResB [Streptomyces xinghaiensis]